MLIKSAKLKTSIIIDSRDDGEEASTTLEDVNKMCEGYGMKINVKKTKLW